ncbi:uncharacterized protein LOC111470743 [Cucurbita maxima]|uniref:SREBP regulating gene protein n=1 Tax=Cucurbita maxima TaxID=3661 RepID=A0A6J1I525_CUCMA|nr:uncharacterized protein LOC111470743 [Cucurbita maxima]
MHRFSLSIVFFQFFLFFPSRISAIRNHIGLAVKNTCRSTIQGRYLLTDDNGRVCDALSIDPLSHCCLGKGDKFSCHGCNLVSQCCNSYEYCVSCCLNPSKTKGEQILKIKISKPATAGTYASVFDFCAGRCRHNSESVVHENAYHGDYHHCFSLPSYSSGVSSTQLEFRLNGINVIVGRQGESCDSVCKSNGQSCVSNKILVLNHCDIIQKYMSCKGGCIESVGPDHPAEVAYNAPEELNPGACLYSSAQSILTCDGSHPHTMRLCPCA